MNSEKHLKSWKASKKSSKWLRSSLGAEKKLLSYIWILDRYLKDYTKRHFCSFPSWFMLPMEQIGLKWVHRSGPLHPPHPKHKTLLLAVNRVRKELCINARGMENKEDRRRRRESKNCGCEINSSYCSEIKGCFFFFVRTVCRRWNMK